MYCMKNGNLEIKTKDRVYMISKKENIRVKIHHNESVDHFDKFKLSFRAYINGNFSVVIAQKYIQTFYGDYYVNIYTNDQHTEYYILVNKNFIETCL